MSQDLHKVSTDLFDLLADAAVASYQGKTTLASLKRQAAEPLMAKLKESHEKGVPSPFAGSPDSVNFLYQCLAMLLEKKQFYYLNSDDTGLNICNKLIEDFVALGTLLGFTVNIFNGDEDE